MAGYRDCTINKAENNIIIYSKSIDCTINKAENNIIIYSK